MLQLRHFASVVFPAPLAPINTTNSPASTSRSISRNAGSGALRYVNERPRSEMIGAIGIGPSQQQQAEDDQRDERRHAGADLSSACAGRVRRQGGDLDAAGRDEIAHDEA